MSRTYTLRKGLKGDAEALVAFNRAMARETESRELSVEVVFAGVSRLLETPGAGFYVVAEHAGEIVGSLLITTEWSDWRNGDFWWIQSVYVLPEHRRNGVYRRLYEFVRAHARDVGNIRGFRLYVERNNRVAQTTYAALGMDQSPYLMYESQ